MTKLPQWKRRLGCFEGFTHFHGKSYDHTTLSGHWGFVLHGTIRRCIDAPGHFLRWTLPGWLCWLACRLRGQRWYVSDSWHGVPGNRASDLQQQIWQDCVSFNVGRDDDFLETLEPKLNELSQLAGEAWGHVWPKEG